MNKITVVLLSSIIVMAGCKAHENDEIIPNKTDLSQCYSGYLSYGYAIVGKGITLKCFSFKEQEVVVEWGKEKVRACIGVEYRFGDRESYVLCTQKEEFETIAARFGEPGGYDNTTEAFLFLDRPIIGIEVVAGADISDEYKKGASLNDVTYLAYASAEKFVSGGYQGKKYEVFNLPINDVNWPVAMVHCNMFLGFDNMLFSSIKPGEYPLTITYFFDNGTELSASASLIK